MRPMPRRQGRRNRAVLVAALLAAPLLSGCYLARQAEGQIRLLLELRAVGEVLSDPALLPEERRTLELVADVKAFGECEMGLARTAAYTTFFDTRGRPVSWIVSACPPDRFEPVTWWFPIAGSVPYKGFFRRQDALEEAAAFMERGYDVSLSPVAAYSTLGYLPDPVLSPMLDDPPEDLAALILHELTHATLYRAGEADFNEGLATFVGRQGAIDYVRARFGEASAPHERALRALEEERRRAARADEAFQRLRELYASDLPRERKLALRDGVAGFRVNNARILMARRYGRLDAFEELWRRAGGNWTRFFALARGGAP